MTSRIAGPTALALIAAGAFGGATLLRAIEQTGIAARTATEVSTQLSEITSLAKKEEAMQTHTLLFAGDIMLSRAVGNIIEHKNDPTFPFQNSADITREADFAFANLENPVSNRGVNQGSMYSFRADPKTIQGLTFAGFDAVSIANNHIFDYGRQALTDTIDLLSVANIIPVGAGKNYDQANAPKYFTINNARLALFAYTNLYPASLKAGIDYAGISDVNEEKMYTAVRSAKEQGNFVIVSFHWGEEYKKYANDTQKRIAHALIDAGANLVIGHHPHVTQEVERYKDGYIAYSLGNFVFDQSFSKATMEGLMLKVTVRNGTIISIEELPIKINPAFQPELIEE